MADEAKQYDMVVIGGGPAGITAASTAAECGRSVALVNAHHQLGGAGINTGTVPSKTLRETALALSGIKSRDLYGVDLSLRREVTVADFLRHEENVKGIFHDSLTERFQASHTDIYRGTARFEDPHTLAVQDLAGGAQRLRGGSVLIGTGSSPVRPALFPFGKGEIYDSDTILRLDRVPKTMGVIGAGVIGSEYACTFAALGTKVHIFDGRGELLSFLDGEISRALTAALERRGIVFHWRETVQACSVQDGGQVTLALASGASLSFDAVLVASGRQSNTDVLNLAAAGVTVGERGIIPVDKNYRTNVPHIYAAGDVIGFPALASTSMEQARRAVRHAFGQPASPLAHLLPNGIYTIPEVSMVGETEESLRKSGVEFVAGCAPYANNARGRIIGDNEGLLKLLFRRGDMRLLGVHIMGELATEVVHIGLMVMMVDGTAETFIEACFNVPTLSTLYKTATIEALKNAAKLAPSS